MYKKLLLIPLIAVTAILRLAFCARYLSGDETRILKNAIHFFDKHTIMPTHFNYPTLFSYISALPIKLGAIILAERGSIPSADFLYDLHSTDSILPILPARLTSAVFGILTIFVLLKIGKECFDRETGLMAAAILGFSNIHAFYSGYAFPDAAMTFFATCALLFSLRASGKKSDADYVYAGIFAGLAAATKYNGAFIILAILCVHLASMRDAKTIFSFRYHRGLILCLLAFGCAFLIGTPGWLINPKPFWNALAYEHGHMMSGDIYDVGTPYLRQLYGFWKWEKTTAVLFALGILYSAYRHRKKDIILLALIAVCFAYIGKLGKKDIHYLLFLFPVLSLLSARFITGTMTALKTITHSSIGIFLVVLALAWPVYSTCSQAIEQLSEDNRWTAQRWIHDNIAEGTGIVIDWGYIPKLYSSRFETGRAQWRRQSPFLEKLLKDTPIYKRIPLDYKVEFLKEVDARYLITSSECFDRYMNTPSPPRSSIYASYHKLKDTYSALLFDAETYGWRLLKNVNEGKGPEILIFERTGEPVF